MTQPIAEHWIARSPLNLSGPRPSK
jgi:hypothetical protein